MDNTRDMWKDLKSRYSQGDLRRILELQQEMTSIKQDDQSITDYFTKLRIIWDELEIYRLDPTCSCDPKCAYDVLTSMIERKQQDCIM